MTRSSRLHSLRVSSRGSRRSSSHIACRLVNSPRTPSRTRLVRRLSRRNSGRLVVCLRTGSRIGIGARGMWVPGRFGRRPCNRGSAWDRVRCSEVDEWERTNSESKVLGRWEAIERRLMRGNARLLALEKSLAKLRGAVEEGP